MRNHIIGYVALAWMVSIPCLYAAYDSPSVQKSLQNQRMNERTMKNRMYSEPNRMDMQKDLSRSDSRIKSKIQEKLDAFPWSTEAIEIEVRNGKVTLHGKVATYEQLQLVEERIQDIDGITLIDNQLEIEATRTNGRRSYQQQRQTQRPY